MLISPHYHDWDWKRLNLSDPKTNEDDWQTAANIVGDRVRGRLIKWIDSLAKERFSGFAILALDCVLIESVWGLETGKKSPGKKELYQEFLSRPKFKIGGFDKSAAETFCDCIRNGIAHDGETRKGWLIEKTVPKGAILEKMQGQYRLNRTNFHEAVVAEFDRYLTEVRSGDHDARKKMRNRMEDILKASAPQPE